MQWPLIRKFLKVSRTLPLFLLVPCAALGLQASSGPVPATTSTALNLPDAPVPQEATPSPQSGTISGTVVDKDGAVVPKAKISLAVQRADGKTNAQDVFSDNNGYFFFQDIAPGPFGLTVDAPGFAMQKQSGVLQAGQTYLVPEVKLVVATEVDVQVTETQEQVAEEQIHVEEQQRVLGIFPNYYVSYVPDAAPLNPRQKFQLAWKANVNPFSIGIAGFIAGLEQADDAFSGYGQGAQGYAKRFGATYADTFLGTLIGGAILPTVLKQDPRYFYKGTGTRKSRFFYAVANSVICKGDNGRWQPNYSSMLGALAAGGISNLYYPASSRNGVGLTFENALIGIGGSALGGVFQEFFLRRMTPRTSDSAKAGN